MTAPLLVRAVRAGVLSLALGIVASGNVRAQEPSASAIAAARDLLELKGASSMYDLGLVTVLERVKGLFLQTNPGLAKDADAVVAQLRGEYTARVSEFAAEVAKRYAQRFTEQEIKETIAFYKTPLGRKLLVEEPRFSDDLFMRLQQWQDRLSEDVVNRFRAEMKKRGHNL